MARQLDRAGDFYTTDQVGRSREVTPEGFLICRDVPVARTGSMMYGFGELQDDQGNFLEPGPDGIIHASREADELFRPETIASLNGKSIVDDHPEEDVNPDNWGDHTVGIVLNPRRGQGYDDQMLLADFLVTKKAGIDAINAGKKEVSCGYDCGYEQTEPGQARQRGIVYNHVALVDHGRCGPRCAIGDSDMKVKVRNESFSDRILRMVRARDEEGVAKELQNVEMHDDDEPDAGGEGGEQHIHIHIPGGDKPNGEGGEAKPNGNGNGGEQKAETQDQPEPNGGGAGEAIPEYFKQHVAENNARFDRVEQALAQLGAGAGAGGGNGETQDEETANIFSKEPDGSSVKDEGEPDENELTKVDQHGEAGRTEPKETTDKLRSKGGVKVMDAASLAADFQDTVAKAEIIVPGVKLPTYDAANAANATCLLRRRVLARAIRDGDSGGIVQRVMGESPNLVGMTCDAVKTAFNAVAALASQRNNGVISGAATYDHVHRSGERGPPSIAELNKRHREFWKDRV
jgi:uncharacterized protein